LSTYCLSTWASGRQVPDGLDRESLSCRGKGGDFLPGIESVSHFLSVSQGRKPMPSRAEVLGDETIGRRELLGVSRRLKPLHVPLPLAGGLVGVFRTVVEIAVLPTPDTGQEFPLRCAIAFELVGDDHPWYVGQALEQLPKNFLAGILVSPTLHQDIEDMAVLITARQR
jgi:hypothetical protein